jgi:hypothetical protein
MGDLYGFSSNMGDIFEENPYKSPINSQSPTRFSDFADYSRPGKYLK